MLARVRSAAILGIDAYVVDVEVDVSAGLPAFATVGLAQSAVKEGKERVLAAIQNSGFEPPHRKITINLAPADIKKEGSHFDLPIACGLLQAAELTSAPAREGYALAGELGLDGSLRPIRGALSMAAAIREDGWRGFVIPAANATEAAVVEGLDVRAAESLAEVVEFLEGRGELSAPRVEAADLLNQDFAGSIDLADVRGQLQAKRALEVAAAGAHNILLVGPPGGGKTMLARRLATILPRLTLPEALDVTRVHSVAGELPPGCGLVTARPFRAPHHTISDAGLVGGGSTPRPGEVSLAHHGVLFLDELAEFRRNVLEALRQPMEDGRVTIARSAVTLSYPARFLLAAAMNPCPCGHLGDERRPCRCTPTMIRRYSARISGPLLDRLDLQVEVPAVSSEDLIARMPGETSEEVRARVDRARRRQLERFRDRPGLFANGQMTARDVRKLCRAEETGLSILRTAMTRQGLSARAFHRVLKMARTIADLDDAADPDEPIRFAHIAEAIHYRGIDRRMAALTAS